MIVNQNTKVSKIIAENSHAIETISSINKHFKKLKNPILRKVLATRITVKDAAGIGGVSVQEFLQKLADIGMSVEFPLEDEISDKALITGKFDVSPDKVVTLDVRATIDSGADPFSDIMKKINSLQEGQILQLINVFEPIPLMDVLAKKGFESFTKKISTDEFHTYFKRTGQDLSIKKDELETLNLDDFDTKMVDFGSNLLEIDVRDLEMPEPMTKILETLTSLPENSALFVHHKNVPQFLLPELKSRNYQWLTKEIAPGYVKMLIYNNLKL